jgi:malonate-semialdehyde dehydrogenase (acetylating)/methylmalonate-semialdehyde dehydrogenase
MNTAVDRPALAEQSNAGVRTAKLLIDGKFVESTTKEWRDTVNPATQDLVGRVPFATKEEVDAAVASAVKAFQTWRLTSLGTRMRIMLKFQDLVRQNMKRIAQTLTAEQGKTLPDAEGDIFRGLEVVEHACSIGTLQQGEFSENVAGGVDTYTRRHHAVQLPRDDPALDVPDGDRLRQYVRVEAIGARSAVDHGTG